MVLQLQKKLVMGQKAQYTSQDQKTLQTGIFHTHPCGFYTKNKPFAIEMALNTGMAILHLSQWH